MLPRHERLLHLEQTTRERKIEQDESQIRLLERFSPEFRERHIEVHHTGELVAMDTFFVGTLKGVGKVYMQWVLDCFSRHAWGRLYTHMLPISAVHVLNNDVLPFIESHGAKVKTILSDKGHEFCGRPDQHPYQLFLQLEEIEHRTTRVRRPQSNCFIERLYRTLLDEHFWIQGRSKWYESIDEMQADLDKFLDKIQPEATPPGSKMRGQTPYTVFLKGVPKAPKSQPLKSETKAA